MRVLIIEEDVPLANFLAQSLAAEQYEVRVWRGRDTRTLPIDADLMVLDLGTLVEDGASLIRGIRNQAPSISIVTLTGRGRSEELVRLLDAGADDYLSKPFAYSELSARIRALCRRRNLLTDAILRVGDLKLDRVQRQVERSGKIIALTTKEFALLEFLMRNGGRRLTRAAILEHVWKALPSPGSTNVVDVYIAYLRKKIDGGGAQKLIHTTRGVGYEIRCPQEPPACLALNSSAMASAGSRQ